MAAAATGSSGSSNSSGDQLHVAPFVVKTYQMVVDQRSDSLIRWGKENNSFIVLEPADFSLLVLPAYFKHINFSSFVRQLNTYGFKKVDSDRWEFAHESFLRGQTHLLQFIIRRKKKMDSGRGDKKLHMEEEDDDEDMLLEQVEKLRKEQRMLEEELEGMNKRLQVAEQRPHKMISFLVKVAEDPDLLPRLVLLKKKQLLASGQEKRMRFSNSTNTSLHPLPQSFEMNHPSQSSNCTIFEDNDRNLCSNSQIGMENKVVLLPEFEFGTSETNKIAYPFSLLGHVFF